MLFNLVLVTLLSLAAAGGYYNNHIIKHAPDGFNSVYERKFAYYGGMESDGFGKAVAVYEDTMIVGACFEDMHGAQSGNAHIFRLDNSNRGWYLQDVLVRNNTKAYDYFGWSVALHSTWALVGAWQNDEGGSKAGAAYFYQRQVDGHYVYWNQSQVETGSVGDMFGISLAIGQDLTSIFVGAPGMSADGTNSVGGVYVYTLTDDVWSRVQLLQPYNGRQYDYFGASVSVYNRFAVVGAWGHNEGSGEASGAAYVYMGKNNYQQWTLDKVLSASDANAYDYFGRSVAICETTIVVGADGNDEMGSSAGAVYVFDRKKGAWGFTDKKTPPDGSKLHFFGVSVAIHNGTIVVGADGDDGEGTNSGAVYVYHQDDEDNDWDKLIKLTASDANKYDLFGTSVSVYGDYILVGAEMGDGYDYDSGVAYIYTPIPRFAHVAEEGMADWAIALITISSFGAAAAIGFVAYRYFLQHRGLVQDMDESRNAAGFWVGLRPCITLR